jgi:hypothetical protein
MMANGRACDSRPLSNRIAPGVKSNIRKYLKGWREGTIAETDWLE